MPKIVPKLNLNRTPQIVDNNSLVFAKDIMLNKDGTFSRDEVLFKVLDNAKIAGVISSNKEFYVFLFTENNGDITNSYIRKYVEEDGIPNQTYISINSAWTYSGGKIDGKVIKGLNGDTLLVVNEYDAPVDVPLKIINLNECSLTDDETKYTQTPNIPIVNLNKVSTYSQKIPKGVYQFFIRFEISKGFYTNWLPCSKELYSYNTVYKKIVQGTIKYVDEHADSDFSFVFKINALSDQQNVINKYNRFQLGFILSTNDSNVCRTWKHFSRTYLTNNSPIYFSYNETDIEEYDIDEMLKYTFGLYNVKNVTSFKNKLYISNYKETNFNPSVSNTPTVTYNYLNEIRKVEGLVSGHNNSYTYTEDPADAHYTDAADYTYKYSQVNVTIGGVGYTGTQIITSNKNYFYDVEDPDTLTPFFNHFTTSDTYSNTCGGFTHTYTRNILSSPSLTHPCDTTQIAFVEGDGLVVQFAQDKQNGFYTEDEYIDRLNDMLENISDLPVPNPANSTCKGRWGLVAMNLANAHKNEDYFTLGYINTNNYGTIIKLFVIYRIDVFYKLYIGSGLFEYRHIRVDIANPRASSTRYDAIFEKANVTPITVLNTLMPKTGYNFYVHYVAQNGEITNGYKLNNTGNNVTNWFNKATHRCLPSFSNIIIPEGYKAAFITYSKVKNKYIDVHNSGVSIVGKDGVTYYLYDCIEIDSALSVKWDNIKLYTGTNNTLQDSNAFYRSSSFYDDNLPKLFGATGKIVSTVNVTNPYILDEFTINDDASELVYCTPYFTSSDYEEYELMNLRGFVCDVYKPQNISTYDDAYDNKEDEFKVSDDQTKVIDELTYYYTGTDIYTKAANGDLNQYKGRKDVGESSPISFISEYNLDCLVMSNQFIDITRPYYVKDISEGNTVTTTDATYEHYSGTPDASTWASNYEGKYVIIPDCLCTEAMISNANVVGETVRNLKLNPLSKYLDHTGDNSKRLLFFKTGAITESLSTLRTNSSNCEGNSDIVTDDRSVYYCQKLLSWADLNDALQAGDLQLIDPSDVGSTICRVYKYGPVSEYRKGGVKTITLVTQTKITNKYEDRIVESSIKTSTTYKFDSQRVYADGYNGIVPQADNIQRVTHAYWRTDDFGLIWYGNRGEPTVVKEPSIDVSENNGEVNAYQQYSYIESLNLNALYKLPSMYINITRKSYSIYNSNDNIIRFDNTIRSSDTYTDESKKLTFTFSANSYYNVDCSKGKIVNMIAIGNYILVHTEDSLFNFSGSNSLQTQNGEAKLAESNVFETGITEVVGSQYGYCGLTEKNHACATQNGYIFYDASVRKIYSYSGQGQINVISDDIDKLMKYAKITDVNFANDYYNDRLLICIKYDVNSELKYVTLSFNYRVNSLVSAHNFWFDKSFNTKTNVYYASRQGSNSGAFSAIAYSDVQPSGWLGINDVNDEDFYTSNSITDILPRLKIDGKLASVIDVINNEEYERVKTLEYINWICNGIDSLLRDDDLMAEEKFELSVNANNQYIEKVSKYCGDKVKLYTDSAISEDIEIYANNSINDTYTRPRFNKGVWSLNYFRNINNDNNSPVSDNMSLMYGKYFVVRFMMDRVSHNFKLENLNFKISNL